MTRGEIEGSRVRSHARILHQSVCLQSPGFVPSTRLLLLPQPPPPHQASFNLQWMLSSPPHLSINGPLSQKDCGPFTHSLAILFSEKEKEDQISEGSESLESHANSFQLTTLLSLLRSLHCQGEPGNHIFQNLLAYTALGESLL